MKARKKRIIAKSIFAALSIALIPVHTIFYGFLESPIDYTLSNIGNYFSYRVNFIIWGIVTGVLLLSYILYTYERARFRHERARKYLLLSSLFLILTVATPALKEGLKFWYYIHLLCSILFPLFLVLSLLFFMHYLSENNKKVYSKTLVFLMFSVGFPISLLFVFKKLTGLAEIAFFVCISIFLMLLNIYLNREQKSRLGLAKENTDSNISIS